MSARERLDSYLQSLRNRLRSHIYARAAAVAIGGVLAVTALTVWSLQRREFSPAISAPAAMRREDTISRVGVRSAIVAASAASRLSSGVA